MVDAQTGASGSTSPEGGTSQTGATPPLTKSDIEQIVATLLDSRLRGLQSGTDRQIAQARQEFADRIAALADELGVTAESLLETSAADDETKAAARERLSRAREQARAQPSVIQQRIAFMQERLQEAGLSEDDLPHTLAQYARQPDGEMFKEALRRARERKVATQTSAQRTPEPNQTQQLEAKIAALEAEIRRLKGEDVVPEGGTGTPTFRPRSVEDWLRNSDAIEELASRAKRQKLGTP